MRADAACRAQRRGPPGNIHVYRGLGDPRRSGILHREFGLRVGGECRRQERTAGMKTSKEMGAWTTYVGCGGIFLLPKPLVNALRLRLGDTAVIASIAGAGCYPLAILSQATRRAVEGLDLKPHRETPSIKKTPKQHRGPRRLIPWLVVASDLRRCFWQACDQCARGRVMLVYHKFRFGPNRGQRQLLGFSPLSLYPETLKAALADYQRGRFRRMRLSTLPKKALHRVGRRH